MAPENTCRPEQIGQHVVRAVLIAVMRCLWRALDARPDYVAEVYRAATQFFAMLDPAIVFTHLAERITVHGTCTERPAPTLSIVI